MTARLPVAARACLLALLLTAGRAAMAQELPAPSQELPPPAPEIQALYQDALQSIADGRKNDAKAALERVVNREAQHAGAWLDLALIHCGLGNRAEAESMFEHIEREFAPPPAILELIGEARASACAQWQPLSQLSLSTGRGNSSNVNQGTSASASGLGLPIDLPLSDEFQPMHDQYTMLSADYWRDLSANGSVGFAQVQMRRYDHLHDYDSASLFVGMESPWRVGDWTLRSSGLLGLISLGGELYQQQAQLQLRFEPPLRLPAGMKFNFGTALSDARYRTLSNFDSTTAEFRSQLSYRDTLNYGSVSASYLLDRASADRPGGDRHGWLAQASWRRGLPRDMTGELAYSRQSWDNKLTYTPGFIDTVREQVTQVVRATLSYPLAPRQSLVLEARVVRNRENITLFQYNEHQLQLSWQWQQP